MYDYYKNKSKIYNLLYLIETIIYNIIVKVLKVEVYE